MAARRGISVWHVVEYLSPAQDGAWFVYSRFSNHEFAQQCAERLRSDGNSARVRPVVQA